MIYLPFFLALALFAFSCYKIGYQRCRDATSKGVVIRGVLLTWEQFLDLRRLKTRLIIVQRCVIVEMPAAIRSDADLTTHLAGLSRYAKRWDILDNTFYEKGQL